MNMKVKEINSFFLYANNELPCWWEFKDFLVSRNPKFNPETDVKLNPYWKIPDVLHKLMVYANQLNKFIVEDRMNDKCFILYIPEDPVETFLAPKTEEYSGWRFPIYTCKIPSTGKYDIFIRNDYKRFDIAEYLGKNCELRLVELDQDLNFKGFIADQEMNKVIDYHCRSIIEYFKMHPDDDPGKD